MKNTVFQSSHKNKIAPFQAESHCNLCAILRTRKRGMKLILCHRIIIWTSTSQSPAFSNREPLQLYTSFRQPSYKHSWVRKSSHIGVWLILSCSSSCCWSEALQKSIKLRRFTLHRDEIWQDCSSSKSASIDRVGFSIWRHTFMTATIHASHKKSEIFHGGLYTYTWIPTVPFGTVKKVKINLWFLSKSPKNYPRLTKQTTGTEMTDMTFE